MSLRTRILMFVASVTLALVVPASSPAQSFRSGTGVPGGSGVSGMPYGGANSSYGLGRSQNTLANPVNFFQYSQVTGTGPSMGTVATYNQFGLAGMAYGGALNGSPGTQGAAAPPGVLLSVNNAQMMYPNQMQINNLGFNYPINPYSMYGYPGMGYSPYGYPGMSGYPGMYGAGYPGMYGAGYSGLFGGLGGLGGLGSGIPVGQNQNGKAAGNGN